MALLADGSPNGTEDLRVYETSILDVAHAEGIDLDVKLALAAEEISQDVLEILLGHRADGALAARMVLGVSDVVVTRQMKRWHALHTLAVVYRDAYNNQLNDRYLNKWSEYRGLASEARARTVGFGIGLVAQAVPQAGVPEFAAAAGTGAATLYYARVSWVSATGAEGNPSEVTTFQTSDGSALQVTAANAPAVAVGWNVYLGLSSESLMRQNTAALAVGATFTMGAQGLVAGIAPGAGQAADQYVTGGWTLRRG